MGRITDGSEQYLLIASALADEAQTLFGLTRGGFATANGGKVALGVVEASGMEVFLRAGEGGLDFGGRNLAGGAGGLLPGSFFGLFLLPGLGGFGGSGLGSLRGGPGGRGG